MNFKSDEENQRDADFAELDAAAACLRPDFTKTHKPSGKPVICAKCGHDKFKTNVTDSIGSIVCEYEELCAKCGTRCAYWSYGSYEQ